MRVLPLHFTGGRQLTYVSWCMYYPGILGPELRLFRLEDSHRLGTCREISPCWGS